MCDWCRSRECCVHCLSKCHVCSRRLCGSCVEGFGGPPAVTVCEVCRQRLIHRQTLEDELSLQQTAFDRHVALERMHYQAESLRMAEERMQMMARLQEAKLGAGRRTKMQWALHLVGVTAVQTFKGIQYVVRRSLP